MKQHVKNQLFIYLALLITACNSVSLNAQNCDVPEVSGNDILCNGQSITLTAQAGYTNYAWSNNTTGQSTTVTTPGLYQVTVTCANGNTAFANVNVLGFTTGVQVAGSGTICAGQCVNLSVLLTNGSNGPYTIVFSLSTGGTQSFTVDPSGGGPFTFINVCPTQTTTYTIQSVTNAQGCVAFIAPNLSAATVTVTNGLNIGINGPTSLCPGQSATLTATPSGLQSYQWSNSSSGISTNITQAGTYTVTATASGGCTGTASITVAAANFTPPTITGGTVLCPGTTLTLTAQGSGYTTYNWSNSQTTQSITVSSTGIYTVTVSGSSGCTGTASVTVNPGSSTTTSILGPNTLCPGNNATLIATGSFSSYAWSNNATGSIITVNQPGTYTVTVTNSQGCTGTASKTITPGTPPSVSFSVANPELCAGNCVSLNVSLSGNPPFTVIGEVLSGSTVVGNFTQTYSSSTGTLQVCAPPGTPAGTLQVKATSVADASCTCQ